MAYNLEKTLVIGISATALFDLSEADKLYQDEFKKHPDTAIDIYRAFMLKHEDIPLKEGIGFHLEFGPPELRKKATFDGVDCMLYFLENMKKRKNSIKNNNLMLKNNSN